MRTLLILCVMALIAGCSGSKTTQDGAPNHYFDASTVPDAIPKHEPITRAGNPDTYTVLGKRYSVLSTARGYRERGIASWYGTKFHGRKTSNGETYDMYAMTAAHKSLPIPCYVRVKNLDNGKSTIVRVNDRGPFHPGRIIDLSYAAAKKLGVFGKGTARVEVEAVTPGNLTPAPTITAKSPTRRHIALTDGTHYVQAGAFSTRETAQNLAESLQSVTQFPVTIESNDRNPQGLFKVKIGPLKQRSLAEAIKSKLAHLQEPISAVILSTPKRM